MILLMRYLPWLIGALAIFGAGAWTGNALNPWHGRYQTLQVADAQARADGEEAVRKALSAQLAQAQATSRNNADSMVRLANEQAAVIADRDATVTRVRRLEQLLAAQAARTAASGGLPQAGDRRSTTAPPGDEGIDRAGELLIAARDECRRNTNRFSALIAEVKGQL